MARDYFDWNATVPLRPQARAAMIEAFDALGNPSSIHYEGRAARGIVERSRVQIAHLLDAEGADIIFTSGASEAAALALFGRGLKAANIEHDAVRAWCDTCLETSSQGRVAIENPAQSALQKANSETGIIQDLPPGLAVSDLTQAIGKIPFSFNNSKIQMGFLAAHKFGGPKGIGALVLAPGQDIGARIKGGGQEMGRRAGTENIPAISGFAAGLEAACADLASGAWEGVKKLRTILEKTLVSTGPEVMCLGDSAPRLPNTCCIMAPGWAGETQVIQSDLAGFAISAGSACSSGKIKASTVLAAMGYDPAQSASVIRISLGLGVREEAVLRFSDMWQAQYRKAQNQCATRL